MKTLIYAPYLLVVNYLYLNVFMLIKAVHARTRILQIIINTQAMEKMQRSLKKSCFTYRD